MLAVQEKAAIQSKALIALAQRELQRRSLLEFVKAGWKILEPETPLELGWIHELLCEHLELVTEGKTKRLLINIAPRSLKSLLVSVFWVAWDWLHHPSKPILCMSYSSPLAYEHSDKRRQLIESAWYQSLTQGACELSDRKNRVTEFSNVSQGVIFARGLDGSVTGVGGLTLIFDDPNDPEKVESDEVRNRTLKRFKSYSVTRRNHPTNTSIVVVQQRTHEDDVSGYIIRELEGWTIVKLPTRSPANNIVEFPKSGRRVIREAGSLLQPERFGEAEDREAKKALGSYGYAARHDQEPAPVGGGIFRSDWWQFFDELPPSFQLALSVDPSFGSLSNSASYVVCQLWAIAYPDFYLIDQSRSRCGFTDMKVMIREMIEEWEPILELPITTKLIENKALGPAILDSLREEFPGFIPINVSSDQGKKARAEGVSPIFEAGNVFIRRAAPWLVDYQIEFERFPNYGTDDQVDTTTQLIQYFLNKYRTMRKPLNTAGNRGAIGKKIIA